MKVSFAPASTPSSSSVWLPQDCPAWGLLRGFVRRTAMSRSPVVWWVLMSRWLYWTIVRRLGLVKGPFWGLLRIVLFPLERLSLSSLSSKARISDLDKSIAEISVKMNFDWNRMEICFELRKEPNKTDSQWAWSRVFQDSKKIPAMFSNRHMSIYGKMTSS